MTRDEHLERCKTRAREYLDEGDPENAVASILSDLRKHPAWENADKLMGAMLMLWSLDRSPDNARKIIEGFN